MVDPVYPEYDQIKQEPLSQTDQASVAPQTSLSSSTYEVSKTSSVKMIIMGITLLALITSGGAVYYFSYAKEKEILKPPVQVVSRITPSVTPVVLFLTLGNPSDNTLVVEDEFVVQGKTLPNIPVAISTETDDVIIESNDNGEFQDTLFMNKTDNTLIVTAFGPSGEEKTIKQSLYQVQ